MRALNRSLVTVLTKYIEQKSSHGSRRFIINKLPYHGLIDLYEDLDGFIIKDVMTYLVSFDRININDDYKKTIDLEELNRLRTSQSTDEILIALVNPKHNLPGSIETTFDVFPEKFEEILEELTNLVEIEGHNNRVFPFVRDISKVISNGTGNSFLEELWKSFGIISSFYDSPGHQVDFDRLCSELGYIKGVTINDYKASFQILESLAKGVRSNGLEGFLNEIISSNEEFLIEKPEVKQALIDFTQHVGKNGDVIEFMYTPALVYRNNEEDWWECLDINTWAYLTQSVKSEPDSFQIRETGYFAKDGNVTLFEGEASFQLSSLTERATWQIIKNQPIAVESNSCMITSDDLEDFSGLITIKASVSDRYRTRKFFLFDGNDIPVYIRLPPEKTSRKSSKGNQTIININTRRQGEHILEILVFEGWNVTKIHGDDISSTTDKVDIKIPDAHKFEATDKIYRFSPRIFIDEQCTYTVNVEGPEGQVHTFIIEITSEDADPDEVSNRFEELVWRHLFPGKMSPNITFPHTIIGSVENWIINNEDSYYPILISSDLSQVNLNKKVENNILSNFQLTAQNDPRPSMNEMKGALADLIDIRGELVRKVNEAKELTSTTSIEELDLYETLNSHEDLLADYLSAYIDSLDKGLTEYALWFDTIIFLEAAVNGGTIGGKPVGLILNPTHPICLVWQYSAQKLLSASLENPCPIAGMLNPSNIPSVWFLPRPFSSDLSFLTVTSNMPYWRLFWDLDKVHLLESSEDSFGLLFQELGIEYTMLERGIKKSQISRALNQVSSLLSAKSDLSLLITGVGDQSNETEDGVLNWVSNNLNHNEPLKSRLLSAFHQPSLNVHDDRKHSKRPSSSSISYLRNEFEHNLNWYYENTSSTHDLGVVSILNQQHQEFIERKTLASVIASSGLIRFNTKTAIKGNAIIQGMLALGQEADGTGLNDEITRIAIKVEKLFFEGFRSNAYFFNPDTTVLNDSIDRSLFTAISSSMLDVSFIISQGDKTIWEYDLPSYFGNKAGTDGYYLISKDDNDYKKLFYNTVRKYDSTLSHLPDELLEKHLKVLSNSGAINFKRFIQNGSESHGELGILLAILLLQPVNPNGFEGLFPIRSNGTINLMIPVDPFQERIESLKGAFNWPNKNRPDYLLVSLSDNSLKLNALELKCYTNSLDESKLLEFRERQADDFLRFLNELHLTDRSELWKLSFPSLIAEMIHYSLGIYNSNRLIREEEFIKIQNAISKLVANRINIEFPEKGFLISSSERNTGAWIDESIIAVSKDNVHNLLEGNIREFFKNIHGLDKDHLLVFGNTVKSESKVIDRGDYEPIESLDIAAESDDDSYSEKEAPKLPTSNNPITYDHGNEGSTSENQGFSRLSKDTLDEKYRIILGTFDEHNIGVEKVEIDNQVEGPAFILFRVKPKRGVKINRIESVHDELKLNLALGTNQHIKFDIDRGYINILVPKSDDERYYVYTKDIWSSRNYKTNELAVDIGEDLYGERIGVNFSSTSTPHLLIGGQTGSGKSEALNTIIHGVMEFYSEQQVKLLLVDPKGTEMQQFENSPFLLNQIGFDEEDAVEYLTQAVDEMQSRYKQMKAKKCRSLADYNEKAIVEGFDPLPWWLVVLDEYGDLTHSKESKKEIEELLIRLAQKGRACGIHVIVTTQNPTANVVSSNVRSNLGAQLALKVRGAVESSIILTHKGAETLNGKGDAILRTTRSSTRLQVALVKV